MQYKSISIGTYYLTNAKTRAKNGHPCAIPQMQIMNWYAMFILLGAKIRRERTPFRNDGNDLHARQIAACGYRQMLAQIFAG